MTDLILAGLLWPLPSRNPTASTHVEPFPSESTSTYPHASLASPAAAAAARCSPATCPRSIARGRTDDFEFVNPGYAVEPGTRHGHEGWSEAIDSLDAAFHDYAHELGEATDLGDRVLFLTTFVAKTSADSVAFRQSEPHLWSLRDGKVTRLQWFHDRAEALEAAGLSE